MTRADREFLAYVQHDVGVRRALPAVHVQRLLHLVTQQARVIRRYRQYLRHTGGGQASRRVIEQEPRR